MEETILILLKTTINTEKKEEGESDGENCPQFGQKWAFISLSRFPESSFVSRVTIEFSLGFDTRNISSGRTIHSRRHEILV